MSAFKPDHPHYVVWWLTHEAYRFTVMLGAPRDYWPQYLKILHENYPMYRPRHAYKVSGEIGCVDRPPFRELTDVSVGLMIACDDAKWVIGQPGFVTDCDGVLLTEAPLKSPKPVALRERPNW